MKSARKGFIIPLLIIIIAALAIGGGFYIHNQNQKIAEQAQVNTNASVETSVPPLKDFHSTSSSNVSANTNTQAAANTGLSDRAIVDAFNKTLRGTFLTKGSDGTYSKRSDSGFLGLDSFIKGDINGDGYEDAIVLDTHCGASCGTGFSALINNKDGTAQLIPINFENSNLDIQTSGAAQGEFKALSIDKQVVSIQVTTYSADPGQNATPHTTIRHYKFENNSLVRVD